MDAGRRASGRDLGLRAAGVGRRGFTLLAITAVLTACASVPTTTAPPGDWPSIRTSRQALTHWQLSGRAAVATESQGWSAGVSWKQADQVSDLNVQGALGVGGVHVRADGESLDVETSKGEKVSGEDATSALERTLGVALPIASLRYWLLGVPAPGSDAQEDVDPQGRLASLKQNGWSMTYDRYALQGNDWLPRRVRLERGPVRVKVLVDHWSL
ncbi:MAG TPA: lipoprotein insertase outer membrane protein LolB [Steroidobacteraceae bacterium]